MSLDSKLELLTISLRYTLSGGACIQKGTSMSVISQKEQTLVNAIDLATQLDDMEWLREWKEGNRRQLIELLIYQNLPEDRKAYFVEYIHDNDAFFSLMMDFIEDRFRHILYGETKPVLRG